MGFLPESGPTETPALTEEALIAAFKHGSDRKLRDPRELVTVLARSGKPILFVDEKRIEPPGDPFVFYSVVALPSREAIAALQSITKLCLKATRAASWSAPKLIRENGHEATELRVELERHLEAAKVFRAGLTQKSLTNWKRETGWNGITTVQNRIHIRAREYAILQNLSVACVNWLNLTGLGLMIVDRGGPNGLEALVGESELGAITFDVEGTSCHMAMLASTQEDLTVGGWIRLPDYDAARATRTEGFQQFAAKVREAPQDGTLVYWWP